MVYVREFDGESHNFGVVGVEEGTLLMYDQESGSWWSQLFGEAVRGDMEGEKLVKLPSTMTTWGKWKEMHPDTTVYVKPSIPYQSRFTEDSFSRIASGGDGPLEGDDWVVAIEGHIEARAYLARALAQQRLLHEVFEGAPILVYLSEDLSTARILLRNVGDNQLSFVLADGDKLRDEQTGSIWDPVSGIAVEGPMRSERLQPLISTYSLWFAWEKYRPDTVVWEGESH